MEIQRNSFAKKPPTPQTRQGCLASPITLAKAAWQSVPYMPYSWYQVAVAPYYELFTSGFGDKSFVIDAPRDTAFFCRFAEKTEMVNFLREHLKKIGHPKITAQELYSLTSDSHFPERIFRLPLELIQSFRSEIYRNYNYTINEEALDGIRDFVDLSVVDKAIAKYKEKVEQEQNQRTILDFFGPARLKIADDESREFSSNSNLSFETMLLSEFCSQGPAGSFSFFMDLADNHGSPLSEQEIIDFLYNPTEEILRKFDIDKDCEIEDLRDFVTNLEALNKDFNQRIAKAKEQNPDNPIFDETRLEQAPEHFVSVHHYASVENIIKMGLENQIITRGECPTISDEKKRVDLAYDQAAQEFQRSNYGTDLRKFSRTNSRYAAWGTIPRMIGTEEKIPVEIKVDPKQVLVVDAQYLAGTNTDHYQIKNEIANYWGRAITLEHFMHLDIPSRGKYSSPEIIIPKEAQIYFAVKPLPLRQ